MAIRNAKVIVIIQFSFKKKLKNFLKIVFIIWCKLKIFRRSIAVNLLDLLVICQNMLYSRFAHSPLIEGVIAIKNELDNIIKN